VKTIKETRGFHSFIPSADHEGALEVRLFLSSTTFSTAFLKYASGDDSGKSIYVTENCYTAFVVNQTWQLGLVTEVDPFHNAYYVRYMRRDWSGSFTWTDPMKEDWVDGEDVLCIVPASSTATETTYKLDYQRAKATFNK